MLKNKRIILGVCGSIAAYKAAFLTRLLVKAGAEVKVVMTPAAASFVSPLTFSTLSKNPVNSEYFNAETGDWNNHVELALWADLLLIAPATAHTIASMASGLCDNLLMAVWLSAKCPVMVAPAMDLDMYRHPTFLRNINALKQMNVEVIESGHGELASGLIGEGRMEEPEQILSLVVKKLGSPDFKGRKILVNAGPTYEFIDPVRFIGNLSSGKMGYSLAEELANRGAEVHLVSGPVSIQTSHPGIHLYHITGADEMYETCTELFPNMDAAILSAAVADYKPAQKASAKIKKKSDTMELELVKTPDTLAALGKIKKGQILIGFALETDREEQNAKEKLEKKNLDAIVLNSLNDKGAGFMSDTNKITLIDNKGEKVNFELKSKKAVAADIADYLSRRLK